MIKYCLNCSTEFKTSPSRILKGSGKYCSWNCSNKFNGIKLRGNNPRCTSINKTCLICKNKYIVKNYRKDVAKFCSMLCKIKAQDQGKTTIHERIRKSLVYEEWRKAVFERDNYTCQDCGEIGGYLQADHIKPFALYPESRLDLNNGRTLCIGCHKKTDTYGRATIYRKDVVAVQTQA